MRQEESKRRVAEELAASLREQIVAGRINPGEALPSERELAEHFDVNRSSVREALHRLEAVGLIEMRHGGATRVRDFLISAGVHVLPYIIAPGGRVDGGWLRDLLEVRVMFLAWCGEQAARRATSDDVERLDRIAAELRTARQDPRTLQALDWAFFEALVGTTQNRVLALLSNVVREVHERHASRFKALYEADAFDPRHHRKAVEAIRRRDEAGAGAAMRAHGENALKVTRGKA